MDEMQSQTHGIRDKGTLFIIFVLLFTILALLFTLLRVYIRTWVTRNFGWDDGVIVLALVLAVVSSAFNIPEVVAGYGQHLDLLSEHQLTEALKWNYLATVLLVFSLAASKISISIFLVRILRQTQASKLQKLFPYAIMLLVTVIAVPSAGYTLGRCQPVRKLWSPMTPGHCQDLQIYVNLGYANGAINASCDFALALFPFSFIKDLYLLFHKKMILGMLMSCGIVCGALAITRTILTGDLTTTSDITYDSVNSALLAIVEENVSIIVACIPTLGPFYKFFSEKFRSIRTRRQHTPIIDNPQSSQEESTLRLKALGQPLRKAINYESSATHSGKDNRDGYGDQSALVSSIRKKTTVEIHRDDDFV